MPWCPKCKNEYREGITVCVDCGCELVEEEQIARIFLEQEAEMTKEPPIAEETQTTTEPTAVYRKNADKAEDNKSSGWTLLVVGAAGMVFMILGITGMLPFQIGNPYMFYGVMSAVFLLFIVMGGISMKNAKIFEKKAESENTLRQTLEKWCSESLKAAEIDKELGITAVNAGELSDAALYFKRYEKLKEKLNHQFMNLDQAFLDNFIDETVYDMVFGE